MCDVNFQWHLLLFTFYYCQCFSNFGCQSINLFQVLNWYILTFDNKCAQKQFYCEICNMQNTNYFQYWQFCFICHSNWGFMSNNETFSYLFLQKYQKNNQSFLFISLKIHPLFFNDLFIKCSSSVVCTLFLNNCQFIQYVNNWPFSSIEWNSDLTNKSIDWIVCVKVLVSSLVQLSFCLGSALSIFSSQHFFSRDSKRAELY